MSSMDELEFKNLAEGDIFFKCEPHKPVALLRCDLGEKSKMVSAVDGKPALVFAKPNPDDPLFQCRLILSDLWMYKLPDADLISSWKADRTRRIYQKRDCCANWLARLLPEEKEEAWSVPLTPERFAMIKPGGYFVRRAPNGEALSLFQIKKAPTFVKGPRTSFFEVSDDPSENVALTDVPTVWTATVQDAERWKDTMLSDLARRAEEYSATAEAMKARRGAVSKDGAYRDACEAQREIYERSVRDRGHVQDG